MEVKIGDKRSDQFPVSTGLRQGCVLSPLLFSLYINGLMVELTMKRCGVECGGLLVPGLLYADDTSLFGENVQGLERSLLALEEWCSRWGMKVNHHHHHHHHHYFNKGGHSFSRADLPRVPNVQCTDVRILQRN